MVGAMTYDADMRTSDRSLFEVALGDAAFSDLPEAIRAIHDRRPSKEFRGEATIRRGSGLIATAVNWMFGFPKAGERVPTSVRIERTAQGETWTRRFGNAVFQSRLTPPPSKSPGWITERVGPLSFDIDLDARLGRLYYPIGFMRIGSIPLPWFITPRSDTVEHLTGADTFYFSIHVKLPVFGLLIAYEGWLEDATKS
jgi:hypothetical protein